MGKKLTPKQQKFCNEIIKGKNPSAAYISAYNPKNQNKETIAVHACHLMKNANILPIIQEKQKEIQQEVVYTAKDSFNKICEIQKMALETKRHIATADGDVVTVDEPDLRAALEAEKMKGKLLGLYTEKIKAEVESKVVQVVFHSEFKGL